MKSIILFLASIPFFFLSSCTKFAGPGGSSTIKGKIYIVDKDGAGNILSEYDGFKEDVFIIYGTDSESFDDDVKTSYDGTFKFTNLEIGTYTLFAYEDCNSCPGGKKVVLFSAEITEKKSTVDVGTITIIK